MLNVTTTPKKKITRIDTLKFFIQVTKLLIFSHLSLNMLTDLVFLSLKCHFAMILGNFVPKLVQYEYKGIYK